MTTNAPPRATDRDQPEREGPDPAPRPWPAAHVLVTVLVALAVGTLLNAQALLATAERQPFGWQRDAAVAVTEPIASLAATLGLDRPRDLIDTALGRVEDDPVVVDDEPVVADPPTRPPSPSAVDTASDAPTPSTTPSPEPTTLNGVQRGPVTARDPLRLYIAGDSMVEIQFGIALEDLADDTGMIETLAIDFDRGSGLSRPDYVDWPARLAAASAEVDPDVMLVYFGGNDAQPLKVDGVVYEPEDPQWQAEYRTRVAALMDQLTEAGHFVYWMGLPIPSSERMVRRFGLLNDVYESEAATRDMVAYVPTWDLFADAQGVYREYLPDEDGDLADMRLDDGIHFSTAGAYRAARPTLARILDDWGIEPRDAES